MTSIHPVPVPPIPIATATLKSPDPDLTDISRLNYERYHQHVLSGVSAAHDREEAQRRRRLRRGRPWELRNGWEADPRVGSVHVRPPPAAASVDDTLLWAARVVGAALAERLLCDAMYVSGERGRED